MTTLAELLPEVPKKSRNRYAAALRAAGLVSPLSLGDGRALAYSPEDAERVRALAARVAAGESIAVAVRAMRPACPGPSRPEPAHVPPCPGSGHLEPAAVEAVGATSNGEAGETATAAEFAATLARLASLEAAVRQGEDETAAMSEKMEQAQAEATAARRAAAEAHEEARNGRARLARIEAAIKQGKPSGVLARVRAALAVLFGQAAAVPALPEFSSASTLEELRRAA